MGMLNAVSKFAGLTARNAALDDTELTGLDLMRTICGPEEVRAFLLEVISEIIARGKSTERAVRAGQNDEAQAELHSLRNSLLACNLDAAGETCDRMAYALTIGVNAAGFIPVLKRTIDEAVLKLVNAPEIRNFTVPIAR